MNFRRITVSFVTVSMIAFPSFNVLASKPKKPSAAYQKAQKNFVSACLQSFKTASKEMDDGISKNICECIAKDSHFEGVKISSLKRETEKIRNNPKYEIQDDALVSSFRYCTIRLMKQADADITRAEGGTPDQDTD